MNPFWSRAEKEHRLKSMFAVLARELDEEASRKQKEIAKFESLSEDPVGFVEYQRNSGLTKDVCERILSEVREDLKMCANLEISCSELNAIDGEKDLKTIYRNVSDVHIVWTATDGQKPVDLIVFRPNDASVLGGDCKFGIKSDEPWIIRKEKQFNKEFADKFQSVGSVLKANDGIDIGSQMLLVATSALAPLLKNRIEDYKLDPEYSSIPYDRVYVCSVDDVYDVCGKLLDWEN